MKNFVCSELLKKALQKSGVVAAFGLMFLGGIAHADVLALYTFNNSRASTDTNVNSLAGDFTDGAGFAGGTQYTGAGSPAPSVSVLTTFTNGTDQPSTVAANDFFSFTIAPTSGIALDLTDLTFQTSTSSIQGQYFLRSSVDGFTSNLTSFSHTQGVTFTSRTADLSGAAFNNLTSSTEFRFYMYDASNSTSANLRLDNVTLNGETISATATPEPETWAMMILGVCALGVLQVRRKRSGASADNSFEILS